MGRQQKHQEGHRIERREKRARERQSEQAFSRPGPTIRPLWLPAGRRADPGGPLHLDAALGDALTLRPDVASVHRPQLEEPKMSMIAALGSGLAGACALTAETENE